MRGDPVFLYSILSIVALYVVNINYMPIVNVVGYHLEHYFLGSLYSFTIVSLIIGSLLNEKLKKRSHLVWNLVGILFGITLLLPISGHVGLLLYSTLGGLATGFCVPCTVASVMNRTSFENRGSISGLFIMIAYMLIVIAVLLIGSATYMGIFLILIKLSSILLASKLELNKDIPVESPYVRYGANAKVAFCFVWFLFTLVDMTVSIISAKLVLGIDLFILRTTTWLVGLISMLVGGVLMDEIGRKKLIVFSYAYLGLEYALISLSGGYVFKYTFLDGIAWGILTVFFTMVLGGDIVFPRTRPLFVSIIFTIPIIGQYIGKVLRDIRIELQIQQVFPLASLFLFLAVVMLLILPETLPDKLIQKKELQDYLQRAKKIKEKYQ